MSKFLPDVADITTGKLDANAAVIGGEYPFFTCAPEPSQIDSFVFDEDAVLLAGNNAQGNFHISRYNGKFNAYQRTYVITAKDGYDIDYISYSIEIALSHLKKIAQGSQTKFLTKQILDSFIIADRDLQAQKDIVKILKPIDDKIINNNRELMILEEMVKTIYDYWFVQFDFPDANGNPYKTSGGKMEWNETLSREIPAGWEVKKIKEIADVIAGGDKPEEYSAIKTEKYTVPIYTNGVDKDGLYGYCEAGRVNEDSITIGARGNIGYTKFRQGGYLPIIRLISVTPKDQRYLEYLGFFLKDYPYRKNGSVQNQLPVPDVEDILIVVPDVSLVKKYHEQASLCLNKYHLIKDEMEELCSLRDFLLPMLMNGQVTFRQ